jgi:hypothetical protein
MNAIGLLLSFARSTNKHTHTHTHTHTTTRVSQGTIAPFTIISTNDSHRHSLNGAGNWESKMEPPSPTLLQTQLPIAFADGDPVRASASVLHPISQEYEGKDMTFLTGVEAL